MLHGCATQFQIPMWTQIDHANETYQRLLGAKAPGTSSIVKSFLGFLQWTCWEFDEWMMNHQTANGTAI